MSAMHPLPVVVAKLGPPFTVEGVRNALARGKFRGLGRKWGGVWYLTDEDMVALLDRLKVSGDVTDLDDPRPAPSIPTAGPSGVSARSPRFRKAAS